MKKILIALMALVLVGCSQAEPDEKEIPTPEVTPEETMVPEETVIPDGEFETTVLKLVTDTTESTITYYHEGNLAKKQTTVNVVNIKMLEGSLTAEELEEKFMEAEKAYSQVEGLTYSYAQDEDFATENIEVDFTTVDVDAAAELVGMYLAGDVSNGVDLEASIKVLEGLGYTQQ